MSEQTSVKIAPSLGYHEEKNDTVIRLVSSRKRKKEYQVTGINDVASNNNWKAWLYLAPVLILLVVFLLYPLVNTMFIAFTDNYKYATGEYDGFTINNFGVKINPDSKFVHICSLILPLRRGGEIHLD